MEILDFRENFYTVQSRFPIFLGDALTPTLPAVQSAANEARERDDITNILSKFEKNINSSKTFEKRCLIPSRVRSVCQPRRLPGGL